VDALSSYVNDPDYNDDLLHATLNTYMMAGRDTIGTTLPWIFYNIATNPHVVYRIRGELAPIVSRKAAISSAATTMFEPEEVKALVYLQATLLETLRLYPPVPIERKSVVTADVMPSGHEVCAQDIVIVSLYSVGRMEAVWGADCLEYRPERWLSEDGCKLQFVPSHKFLAFN
jgi:cytochrome P450